MHAVVVRSIFASQDINNIWGSDRFLTIQCQFDVEKVQAIVVKFLFGNQEYYKIVGLEPFLMYQIIFYSCTNARTCRDTEKIN